MGNYYVYDRALFITILQKHLNVFFLNKCPNHKDVSNEIVLWGVALGDAQGLLLTLLSGITSGRSYETIWRVG